MTSRRAFVLLSAALCAGLCSCSTPPAAEPAADPDPPEEEATVHVLFPKTFLAFCGLEADEVVEDFRGGDIPAAVDAVEQDGAVLLTLTDDQLLEQVAAWEDEIEGRLDSLRSSRSVVSAEVGDDLRSVRVTALPSLVDDTQAGVDIYMIIGGCGYLQIFDGRQDWSVELAIVDSDTGAEVACGTLPEEGVTISAEIWEQATGGV